MTIELNKYKYIECIIMNPTCNIYYHPSRDVNAEAEISKFLVECSCSSLYTSEEISEIIALYIRLVLVYQSVVL